MVLEAWQLYVFISSLATESVGTKSGTINVKFFVPKRGMITVNIPFLFHRAQICDQPSLNLHSGFEIS